MEFLRPTKITLIIVKLSAWESGCTMIRAKKCDSIKLECSEGKIFQIQSLPRPNEITRAFVEPLECYKVQIGTERKCRIFFGCLQAKFARFQFQIGIADHNFEKSFDSWNDKTFLLSV